MNLLGFDIGGANVKAVKISLIDKTIRLNNVVREYHPLWIRGINSLKLLLKKIKDNLLAGMSNYYVGVCMTAELSDVFKTKDEGVKTVIDIIEEVYSDAQARYYVSVDMELMKASKALKNPMKIAAANWAASAWLLKRKCVDWGIYNALFIDIGSTTTTLIPMVNCEIKVRGFNDPDKLVYGELVYTGVLRGNVATIVDRIPYKGFYAKVSSERFALMGDVHLVLGYISSEEYTTETADGQGRTIKEAAQRLARLPCADSNIMNFSEIIEMARYIYEKQVFKIFEAIMQIRSWLASQGIDLDEFTVITAGIGEYLATEASRRSGFKKIISINQLVGSRVASVLPAYASALMVLDKVISHGKTSST